MVELREELESATATADRLHKLGMLLNHSSRWLNDADNKVLNKVVGAEIDKLANDLWWRLTWIQQDLNRKDEPEETQPEAVEAEEPLL